MNSTTEPEKAKCIVVYKTVHHCYFFLDNDKSIVEYCVAKCHSLHLCVLKCLNSSDAIMFTGNYLLNLDSKGRVNIPAKYKEILESKYSDVLFITKRTNYLVAYPQTEWDILVDQVRQLPSLKREVIEFKRLFLGSAHEVTMKHGRILIPTDLRNHAGLDKVVVAVGLDNTFEIWAKNRWDEFFQDRQESLDDLGDKLASLGNKLADIK